MDIGILGDGQLARMLALAGHAMGQKITVLAHQDTSPAALVCRDAIISPLHSSEGLQALTSHCDRVVFESEFVDCDLIENVPGLAEKCRPGLKAIRTLQDKKSQKDFLVKLGIPTARYVTLPQNSPSLEKDLEQKRRDFPSGFVLKYARLGYDGQGVKVILPQDDLSGARSFVENAWKKNIAVYAEEYIAYTQELAIIAARAQNGEFLVYPLMISEQEQGVCRRVYGPAVAFGVDPVHHWQAREFATAIGEQLQMVGVFALELFLTQQGTLLVNEIAPRVHNSGHYTMNGPAFSQFENHLRAACDLPLGKHVLTGIFAMENLLGPADVRTSFSVPLPKAQAQHHLHWYGKKELRPRRKMGHLNAWTHLYEDKANLVASLKAAAEDWHRQLLENPQHG